MKRQQSAAEDAAETTATYSTSSALEMHVAESKAGAEIGSSKSKNSMMKGTMIIMVLTMTNHTGSGHQKWDTS
jgi:acetyl/propionyl-CoA carboxylase alpha subunit